MPKLNKTQQYAIRWLDSQNNTCESIAHELKIPIDDVKKTIEKYGVSNNTDKIKDKTKAVINETSGKKTKGVTIMTPESSQQVDATRAKSKNIVNNPNIFRPNNG